MEHIRQGVIHETSGSFYIGEDSAAAGALCYGGSEAFFPLHPAGNKAIPLPDGVYVSNFLENPPQMLNGRLMGIPATPSQALPLDMHQAALEHSLRPDRLQKRLYLL